MLARWVCLLKPRTKITSTPKRIMVFCVTKCLFWKQQLTYAFSNEQRKQSQNFELTQQLRFFLFSHKLYVNALALIGYGKRKFRKHIVVKPVKVEKAFVCQVHLLAMALLNRLKLVVLRDLFAVFPEVVCLWRWIHQSLAFACKHQSALELRIRQMVEQPLLDVVQIQQEWYFNFSLCFEGKSNIN